jgi:hypothetical protein
VKDEPMPTHSPAFAAIAAPDLLPLARRLDAHIEVAGEDWIYSGALNHNGYPIISTTGKNVARAHRIAYQIAVGPIPFGLHIDHVQDRGCRSRACVRPAHLEAITQAENNRRAAAFRRLNRAAQMGLAA